MENQSKKNKKLRSLISFIIFFLLMGAIGYFIGKMASSSDSTPSEGLNTPLVIIGGMFMLFTVLIVHELGHLITGLLQGFSFQLFVVGFLGIKRDEQQHIRPYLNTDWNFFGGVASTSPRKTDPDNAKKFARILLAGPIASLIFSAICFGISTMTADESWELIWIIGGAMSAGIFLATTVPARTGLFFTDRKRYQRLIKEGKARDIELALLRLNATFTQDKSMKNVAFSDIELLKTEELPLMKLSGHFYEVLYYKEVMPEQLPTALEAYKLQAEDMPASIVKFFDKELALEQT